MQRSIFIFLLIFSGTVTYGQSRLGKRLDDKVLHSVVSVSGDLYTGIDNQLYFNDSSYRDFDKIELVCNNGILIQDSGYVLIPLRAGNLRIVLNGYRNGSQFILGHRYFNVQNLPPQKIALDGLILDQYSKLPRSKIESAKNLSIYISEDIVGSDKWFQVSEFTVGYSYAGHFISVTNIGDKINKETLKFFSDLKNGQVITFKAVVTNSSSIIKTMPTIKVIVTD